VRGLQNHDRPVEEVHRGQRAAINLAGVRHDEIGRGHELATLGHLAASRLLTVRLNLLPTAGRPLRSRARVHCHIGTAELMASVVLLDRDQLVPGDWAPAQLFLSRPVAATWSQAFIVRSESPVVTIGGGQLLDPVAQKIRRRDRERAARVAGLWSEDRTERAAAALYFRGLRPWQPLDLVRATGVEEVEPLIAELARSGCLVEIPVGPTRRVRVERDVLAEVDARLIETLERMHRAAPLEPVFEPARVFQRLEYLGEPGLLAARIAALAESGQVRTTDRGVGLASHGPQLSRAERELYAQLVERYRTAGFQPPSVRELQAETTKNRTAVPQLVSLAANEGSLVAVAADLYLHADCERAMRDKVSQRMSGGAGLTVSDIRDLLGTTRKYAVPLCEYLDRIGLTRREGDLRVLKAAGE